MTIPDQFHHRLSRAEAHAERLAKNPAPTFPKYKYFEMATDGAPKDFSSRIFIPGIAGSGYKSYPGYNAVFSFIQATGQYSVTFQSEIGITYELEGRNQINAGLTTFAVGTGGLLTITTAILPGIQDFSTRTHGAAWLFRHDKPGTYDPTWGYYATDVLDMMTGDPVIQINMGEPSAYNLELSIDWHYDGVRTVTAHFLNQDDNFQQILLMAGTAYAGSTRYTDPAVGSLTGPFPGASVLTSTFVLSEVPEERAFVMTLGTINVSN